MQSACVLCLSPFALCLRVCVCGPRPCAAPAAAAPCPWLGRAGPRGGAGHRPPPSSPQRPARRRRRGGSLARRGPAPSPPGAAPLRACESGLCRARAAAGAGADGQPPPRGSMEKAAGEGGGSNSSSRSSSRPTSAGSSPSSSSASRGLPGRAAAAGRLDGGGGGGSSSPGSAAASPGGAQAPGGGRRREPVLEGTLSKYTNLLQGWQSRYFVLDFETGILQYFMNEQTKNQSPKPRGALSLAGAIISPSDEVPHMLVVYSANGEMYKLRAADAKEKQYWITQLRSCAKHHKESDSKSISSSRSRSSSLLPPGTANSASPSGQKYTNQSGSTVVTITHHKSPAAARRVKSQRSGQLNEVREIMSQAEGQQKNLVQAIESLPNSGPLTALDQDLLLLKATSAATLSCLGECLSLLQQSMHQVGPQHNRTLSSDGILGWPGPKSHSTEELKNGALSSLSSASANITWASTIVPSAAQDVQALQPNTEGVLKHPLFEETHSCVSDTPCTENLSS